MAVRDLLSITGTRSSHTIRSPHLCPGQVLICLVQVNQQFGTPKINFTSTYRYNCVKLFALKYCAAPSTGVVDLQDNPPLTAVYYLFAISFRLSNCYFFLPRDVDAGAVFLHMFLNMRLEFMSYKNVDRPSASWECEMSENFRIVAYCAEYGQ